MFYKVFDAAFSVKISFAPVQTFWKHSPGNLNKSGEHLKLSPINSSLVPVSDKIATIFS